MGDGALRAWRIPLWVRPARVTYPLTARRPTQARRSIRASILSSWSHPRERHRHGRAHPGGRRGPHARHGAAGALGAQGRRRAAGAQPFVDKFIAVAARQNGWADAKGQYHTTRSSAEPWIQAQKPHYGILSLGAFLGLKDKYSLDVIGQVSVARAGGQQYHVVS